MMSWECLLAADDRAGGAPPDRARDGRLADGSFFSACAKENNGSVTIPATIRRFNSNNSWYSLTNLGNSRRRVTWHLRC